VRVTPDRATHQGEHLMTKFKRLMVVGMIAAIPLATSACRIDVGNGCQLLLFEPGADAGVVCDVF
jgi:hypothetical protein